MSATGKPRSTACAAGSCWPRRSPAAPASAEACYRRALEVARRQGARSFELRAAVSLSRLWQAAGRHDEARELLAPIYERFTEGLDHPELREAAALLAELRSVMNPT